MGFTAFNPPPQYGAGSPSFRGNAGFSVSVGANAGFGGRRGHHRSGGYGYGYGYGAPIYGYPVYVPAYDPQREPQPVADVPSGNALEREMWSRAAARLDNAGNTNAGNTNGDAGNANAGADPRYGEHYLDGREAAGRTGSSAAPKPEPAPRIEDDGPSIVLVLRDGTRVELSNYAIVGQTIFDLDFSHRARKIPLAELDLPATEKANDALGLDFKLPAR